MSKYSFNIEELDGAVKISDSFADVARKLGYNEKNKYHINKIQLEIKKYNISTSHFYSIKKLRKWDKITKELLIDLVKNNESIKDILNNLDLSLSTKNYKKLKQYLSDFNIDYNFKFSVRENGNNIYTEDKLKSIAKISYTYKDMCKNLGLSTTGNNNKTIKKYIERFNIDISHFNPHRNSFKNLKNKKLIKDILVQNSTYTCTSNLKERLYKEDLKQKKCELCSQSEEWRGKKMSLILDHINGVNNDNRIENLRIVCPNCNATLPTHCGKLSYQERQRRLNEKEAARKKNPTGHGEKWEKYIIEQRRVERPPYEQLMSEVKQNGYSATGRKYWVSDTAIRKWIKYYEKY
jgi:hypothetical protein